MTTARTTTTEDTRRVDTGRRLNSIGCSCIAILICVDDDSKRRAAARAHWPGAKARLGSEDESAAPHGATPSECVAMVWQLTLDAWAMSGRTIPQYSRAEMPGSIVRGRGGAT